MVSSQVYSVAASAVESLVLRDPSSLRHHHMSSVASELRLLSIKLAQMSSVRDTLVMESGQADDLVSFKGTLVGKELRLNALHHPVAGRVNRGPRMGVEKAGLKLMLKIQDER